MIYFQSAYHLVSLNVVQAFVFLLLSFFECLFQCCVSFLLLHLQSPTKLIFLNEFDYTINSKHSLLNKVCWLINFMNNLKNEILNLNSNLKTIYQF